MIPGGPTIALAFSAVVTAPPAPLPDPAARVERLREMLRQAGVGQNCRADGLTGDIIVCARVERIPLPVEPPLPDSIIPREFRAPPPGGGTGVGVVARACFLQKCPKPLMPAIDFARLAPPPAGSDADRIAQGAVRDR